MTDTDAPIFIFKTHGETDAAVRRLISCGFDPKDLSVIGRGYQSEQHPVGFYSTGDRIRSWGRSGALWDGLWSLLIAPAVFFLPGLGLVAMVGPFVSVFVGVLEGTALIGGASAIGAALVRLGVPEHQVVEFENALTVDRYVLMVHGTAAEAHRARMVLLENGAVEVP